MLAQVLRNGFLCYSVLKLWESLDELSSLSLQHCFVEFHETNVFVTAFCEILNAKNIVCEADFAVAIQCTNTCDSKRFISCHFNLPLKKLL